MPATTRRQILQRAAGLLSTLTSLARPAPADSTATLTEHGCVLAIAQLHQGQLIPQSKVAGCRQEPDAPAIFQAASLAKPLVATLVLRLALREQLDIDRPLSDLLPDGYIHRQNLFALRESPVVDAVPHGVLKRITTRKLLSHTSGLPNWSAAGPLRLAFEPGSRWGYSGEGYVLLQHLLQVLTGQALHELAASELFGPLGMQDSAFKLTDRIAQWLIPGRAASGQIRLLRFPYEIAASSLYTTATDYASFIAATLADERLMKLITEAPVPVPGAPNVYWGLGWGIEQTNALQAIWHWGNTPGFRSLAMADLLSRDAAVVLTALDNGMDRAKAALQQALPGPHPGLQLSLVR